MTEELRKSIIQTIALCLRTKFSSYTPKSNYMPFHHRLLGKDRYALYSFLHSLNTTFGQSVFEPIAISLAQSKFTFAKSQYSVGNELYSNCSDVINQIMSDLEISKRSPDRMDEIRLLRDSLTGTKVPRDPTLVDLYMVDGNGKHWLFDMKSPKPNMGEFAGFKRTLLTWMGMAMTKDPNISVSAMIAITYNPHYPGPYKSWQMRGMLERDEILDRKSVV